jgi:uncharacterized membrane protein
MLSSRVFAGLPEWIEGASIVIEAFAVAIIVGGVAYASVLILYRLWSHASGSHFVAYRATLGRSLLLGLEILVAADVIRTVALEPTLDNVAVLLLLVLIRTFLSWSISVEIEGRWPWQPQRCIGTNQSE